MGLFLLILTVDFAMQVVFGTIAILLKTEKFFDFIGTMTFVTCTVISFHYEDTSGVFEIKLVHAACICCWAVKLGSFLLYRVLKAGGDPRFDVVKHIPAKFFKWWMIQGIWVYLNLLPSLFIFTAKKERPELAFICLIGWVIFAFGLIFETVADYQKVAFRSNPANKGKFITTGLWSISRHPNYFGEIVLWFGLFVSSVPFFSSSWMFLVVVCPALTALLILRVSGVPLLEEAGMKRWGEDPQYQAYLDNTSSVIPCLGGASRYSKKLC